MKERPTIEATRLILRPFPLAEAPAVQRLAGDRDIASTTLHVPHPYEDGMAEQWIGTHQERYERGESINFALVLRATNGFVGALS
jgi:RimJ/RimL family protein N-acetyltransferase